MQARHAVDALFAPHRMPVRQADVPYRTRVDAYSARDAAFVHMEPLGANDETDKQRVYDIRFQPGCTAFTDLPYLLPLKHITGNGGDGTPRIFYLLAAKRLIVQTKHRYIGIGHCNGPSGIQREMPRQAVHTLPRIVTACTHGITITAIRQPELRQETHQGTGCIP